jgi:anti-anti-sigma factor
MSGPALRLDGELTIYRAGELKDLLLPPPAGAAGEDLVLDLSGVSEIDSAGVQLLLVLQRDALATGRALRLAAPSAAVAEALTLLGLQQQFNTAAA